MNQQNTNTEDTIDLKNCFFADRSVEAIALCVIFKRCICSTYLRVTPDTYSVDALVQDSKGCCTFR